MIETLAASPLAHAIGLALVQFLWQGAAIGVVTLVALAALKRASAQARYLTACAALALMIAAPVVTIIRSLPESQQLGRVSIAETSVAGTVSDNTVQPPPANLITVVQPSLAQTWRARLEPWLPIVVLIWTGGVMALGLHLSRGWLGVLRIRRHSVALRSAALADAIHAMADRLGVTRRLSLVESALVAVPAVIGWLRPAIVVPVSALAGLAPRDLEAILTHELAHIRRGDYLVNLLQCVVEILLFYHPAIWWVSGRIRVEREHCCDDVAASVFDRVSYARALASLEQLQPRPSLAMAANGGSLLNRVRRLVEPGYAPRTPWSGGLAMSAAMIVLVFSFSAFSAANSHTQGAPPSAVKPAEAVAQPPAQSTPVVPLPPEVAKDLEKKVRAAVASLPEAAGKQAAQQAQTGSLKGIVEDRDHGRIPGVTVTVALKSGATRAGVAPAAPQTARTNNQGQFAFTQLPEGDYELTAAIDQFKTAKMHVQVPPVFGSTSTNQLMLIRLEVGTLTETLEVTGGQSTTPTTGARDRNPPAPQRTMPDLLDAARVLYAQGRLAEAEALTKRALAAMQSELMSSPLIAPETVPGAPVRVGGSVEMPTKINDVKPVYPADALAAGVDGIVFIQAILAKDGSVKDAKVITGPDPLRSAALAAVEQWRYTPTKLGGVPVEVSLTVSIVFKRSR